MIFGLAAGLLSALFAVATTAPSDTTTRPVRSFPAIEVTGSPIHDLRSSEQVHLVSPRALRLLPADSYARIAALQAGVVALGEDLHVRGGRAGETALEIAGLPLAEPLRGAAPELPLFAVRDASLLAGGLDADHTGALAGVLAVRTLDPTRDWHTAWRSQSDGRHGQGLDAVNARASGPLGHSPFGIAAAAEARFDDQGLPALRSRGRTDVLGRRFGWRNDNHLNGWLKFAPLEDPARFSLEAFASRRIEQPYDPMFAMDDSTRRYYVELPAGGLFRADTVGQLDSIVTRYRAADHRVMTETRTLGFIASSARTSARGGWQVSAAYLRQHALTSVGLQDRPLGVLANDRLTFGEFAQIRQNPFLVDAGDEAYFRRTTAQRVIAQANVVRVLPDQQLLRAGAGVSEDEVRFFEFDDEAPRVSGVDTTRSFHAWAPGGWAFVQHRWEHGGLVWNSGLRLQYFSAGPQAAGATPHVSVSPRIGFAYPVSVRDAFSVAYVRVQQDPAREYLYDDRYLVYNRRPLGNATLAPSEMISWQAALKHLFDAHWTMQLAVFYRDLYGQIGVRNAPFYPTTFRSVYQNSESGHASGGEIAVHGMFGERGEVHAHYTYLDATGSFSSEDGYAFGPALGERPVALGDHPLDWDQRHSIGIDALWRSRNGWTVSGATQAASGLPWTPTTPDPLAPLAPALTPDQSAVNSRRFGWSSVTDIAVRWSVPRTRGLSALLDVRDLFDARPVWRATLSGYPNPIINARYDEYGAYRTVTGLGGGGYWNDPKGDGHWQWIAVHDPRLQGPPRSVRLGFEWEL